MEKNIYTSGEASLKKMLFRSVVLFGILLPALGTVILGGGELITAYFSVLYDSGFGIVSAQIISILGDVYSFLCLILLYCSVGAHLMSFGGSRSVSNFIILLVSPIISALVSFAVLYLLVVAGWHDYSLQMFFEYIPVYMSSAGLSALVNVLVSIAVFVAFYLSGGLCRNFDEDKRYHKTIKLVFFILILIKVISLGMDIVLSDIAYTSFNGIVGGIVFPILYEVLELGAAFFAVKHFVGYISRKAEKLGVSFG